MKSIILATVLAEDSAVRKINEIQIILQIVKDQRIITSRKLSHKIKRKKHNEQTNMKLCLTFVIVVGSLVTQLLNANPARLLRHKQMRSMLKRNHIMFVAGLLLILDVSVGGTP